MSLREKFLVAIIIGLICGLWMRERADAQGPALLFGIDSSSGASSPVQTDGSNALKVLAK